MTTGGRPARGVPDGSSVELSDAVAVAWAKSWPMGQPTEQWLPLWQHLDDAADVAGMLWDQWVPDSLRRLIGDAMPEGDADARRLVCWLAGVHDIGKATPAFAVRAGELANRMIRAGLPIGPMVHADHQTLRHDVAGAAVLDRWLDRRAGLTRLDRRQLTEIVAGHHGSFPLVSSVQEAPGRPHLIGDEPWTRVQDALLDRAAVRAGVAHRWDAWRALRLPQPVQMLLAGLVVMADWIASGETFPLMPVAVVPQVEDARPPGERATEAWAAISLGARWTPPQIAHDAELRFAARFPWATDGPRPIQTLVTTRAESMGAPGLLMVEAPMGVGKTEAGFLAAEVLAARTGAGGCFIALPTQATSDAMFTRMLAWLERLPADSGSDRLTVALVHGRAGLNREYRDVRFGQRGRAPVYGDVGADWDASPGHDARGDRLRASVNEWMTGRKKAGLASFAVGTIDQVLFGALVARHITLRQLSLASKVVVIDEVHAADVYMSTFLDRALEWLAAAGAPVVLMSATLPAARRVELYLAYERGRRRLLGADPADPAADAAARRALGGDIGYPVVVSTGVEGPTVDVAPRAAESSRVVSVRSLEDDMTTLVNLLTDRLDEGGCAVVVRNTVRRAQETAIALEEAFGVDDVTVVHAQFLAADRVGNDAALLARFGPPADGVRRPGRHVVVGTQVVEQSLDVDFDVMVTDVAPVDLMLQRMGRLHRHRRGDREVERPARLRAAEVHVTGVDWSSAPVPRLDGGGVAVYRTWPLLRALAVLEPHIDRVPLRLPEDIAPLVQQAYDPKGAIPSGWADVVEVAWERYADEQAQRHKNAITFLLPPVGADGRDLYDLSRVGVGAVDEDSPQGQACVRDGGESLEVVVVQRGRDGDRVPEWVPGGGGLLPLRHVEPDPEQARLLAGCALRLPFRLTRQGVIDRVIADLERDWFEGWQRAPYLSGQLALVLDDDGCAEVAGFHLQYDRRHGLVVTDPGRVSDQRQTPDRDTGVDS